MDSSNKKARRNCAGHYVGLERIDKLERSSSVKLICKGYRSLINTKL